MTQNPETSLSLCARPERTFANGHALFATFEGGEIRDGTNKDGSPRLVAYDRGAVVLLDHSFALAGNLLAGPIDMTGAELLAIAIVEGKERAITEPGASLRLAIAYLALLQGAAALLGGKNDG